MYIGRNAQNLKKWPYGRTFVRIIAHYRYKIAANKFMMSNQGNFLPQSHMGKVVV